MIKNENKNSFPPTRKRRPRKRFFSERSERDKPEGPRDSRARAIGTGKNAVSGGVELRRYRSPCGIASATSASVRRGKNRARATIRPAARFLISRPGGEEGHNTRRSSFTPAFLRRTRFSEGSRSSIFSSTDQRIRTDRVTRTEAVTRVSLLVLEFRNDDGSLCSRKRNGF